MNVPIHQKIITANIPWEQNHLEVPVYLIKGGFNVLVDAGPPQRDPGVLSSVFGSFAVSTSDIGLVLLTHDHLDHVGGIPELTAAGRPQVFIHRDDAFFLSHHGQAFDEFYGLGRKLLASKDQMEEEKAGFLAAMGPETVPDRLLADGDVIDAGDGVELRVVALPGHSKGSVGYYWEKEAILIAGDSIPALGGPGGSLPIIVDLGEYERSIDRLSQMDLGTLVFTHQYRGIRLQPATVRRGGEIREYLRDAKEATKRLKAALQQISAGRDDETFAEKVDRVIAAMPGEMGFVPLAKQASPHFSALTVYCGLKG